MLSRQRPHSELRGTRGNWGGGGKFQAFGFDSSLHRLWQQSGGPLQMCASPLWGETICGRPAVGWEVRRILFTRWGTRVHLGDTSGFPLLTDFVFAEVYF